MNDAEQKNQLGDLIHPAMDAMPVAVTIIDTKGTLLYYNPHAAKIVDRQPEHIGTDIRSHHQKADSNEKVDLMIREFAEGRKEPFRYRANPYGEVIWVTIAPIIKDGVFVGCVQTIRPEGGN